MVQVEDVYAHSCAKFLPVLPPCSCRSWPNVTTPDYERQAQYVLELSYVISLTMFPIVTPEARAGWESYSGEQTSWIKQGLAYQEQRIGSDYDYEREEAAMAYLNLVTQGPLEDGQLVRPFIFDVGAQGIFPSQEEDHAVFLPWWQYAPISPALSGINYNTMSQPTRVQSLKSILATQEPMVTSAWDYADEEDPLTKGKKALLDLYLLRWQTGGKKYEDGPVSDLYYPIFDKYEDENYQELAEDKLKMVAVLNSYV